MRLLKLLSKLITIVLIGTLEMFWTALLFLVNLIDGGDAPERMPLGKVWHNYRTGEIDPVKQFDGIYDNHHDQDTYNNNW
jgi:hypothetical protein